LRQGCEAGEKIGAVGIIDKNLPSFDPTADDVVQHTGGVDSS
jgi:hypothetical protein